MLTKFKSNIPPFFLSPPCNNKHQNTYMLSKTTLCAFKLDNNNKYKNYHISKPHANKFLHNKSHATHIKTKQKQKKTQQNKIQKISPKPMWSRTTKRKKL